MTGCGKLDNNGKTVSGAPLACGTKLSYGVGKGTPKVTLVHLCAQCAKGGTQDGHTDQR